MRIGEVVGLHGIDGGLKIAPDSDQWRTWPDNLERVRIDRLASGPTLVRSVRIAAGRPVLLVDGVESREAADALRGALVYRPLQDLPALETDMYYWHELAGARVLSMHGEPAGTVAAIEPGPAHDWLVVHGERGSFLVPFVRAWVRRLPDGTLALQQDPEGI